MKRFSISKSIQTFGLGLTCALFWYGQAVEADTQSSFFTGTINLDGNIKDFFDGSGNPLPGVCVSNSPVGSLGPDANGHDTKGLGKSPVGAIGSLSGVIHPSGFNQRRLIAAYNPYVNGGTVYVGVDLPGGDNSPANPDYWDPAPGIIQRGSVRPFDADGNGEPQFIGRKADGVTPLTNCADASVADIVDVFMCFSPAGAGGALDDPSNIFKAPGTKEFYTLLLIYTNGVAVQVSFLEDNTSASGLAYLSVSNPNFGAVASKSTPGLGAGVPLGWDVEYAITNINANVAPNTRLQFTAVVNSGSNRDGNAQGEDTEVVQCQYLQPLLPTIVTQPASQFPLAGATVNLKVEAYGQAR